MSVNGNGFVFEADEDQRIRETFIYTDANGRHDVIRNFDSVSRPEMVHDKVDLSRVFDQLGGIYTDGESDLEDRRLALRLEEGDFDGDGAEDDVQLTINGLDDFAIDFIDPDNPWSTAFDIGDGTGLYDNIVVAAPASEPAIDPATEEEIEVPEIGSIEAPAPSPEASPEADLLPVTEEPPVAEETPVADEEPVMENTPVADAPVVPEAPVTVVVEEEDTGIEEIRADDNRNVTEVFTLSGENATRQHVVWDFDNISGDNSSSDMLDLSEIFEAMGGIYTDGVNDEADREAALEMTQGDFDGDGVSDDTQLTIEGNDAFGVTFIDPNAAWTTAYDVGHNGEHIDVQVMSQSAEEVAPVVAAPTVDVEEAAPDFDVSEAAPAPAAPAPAPAAAPAPSAPAEPGKFPAHWSKLDNGMNIEFSQIGMVSDAELQHLADIGVEHVRIMIHADLVYQPWQDYDPNNMHIQGTFDFMDRINEAGMAVVITPSNGLDDIPAEWNPYDAASVNDYAEWYGDFAAHVNSRFEPEMVFIESRNEPFMTDVYGWRNIETAILEEVRANAPEFTFVASANGRIGENNWDFIESLTMLPPYDDPNVVYNVHYYEPMNFTHQDAWWHDYFRNIQDRSYPGEQGYNADTIREHFGEAAAWAEEHGTYITVNEIGSIQFADEGQRHLWTSDVREALDEHGFGWTVWEYDKAFGVTETDSNGNTVVTEGFQQALTWGDYQDGDRFEELYGAGTGMEVAAYEEAEPVSESASFSNQPVFEASTVQADPLSTTSWADGGHNEEELFVVTADQANQALTIENFDNLSGSTLVNDQVDLSAVFDSLGGAFTDGFNDEADRENAITMTSGDFDGDGQADDSRLTINGADGFSITFLDPTAEYDTAYDVGNGSGIYDDIIIA